ncbi:MAG TPA: hypothetical protein VHE30_21355 [Polyangiaceae bacterium]|nr:hypothetical protein [Polyangiaceae bacterium]
MQGSFPPKRAVAAALVLSFVPGCGKVTPDPESAPEWQSGSRLRARVLDAGGGARSIEEWVDTATGQACSFVEASDGVTRCLPGHQDSVAFEDAACEKPVLTAPPTSEDANVEWLTFDFLGPESAGVCPTWGVRAGRVTGPSSATTLYSRDFGGNCSVLPYPVEVPPVSVEVVAPDRFVAGHETTGASAGGLASVVREADDGSWQTVNVRDLSRQADCASFSSRSGDQRCVPNTHVGWRTGRYFADAGCTDDVAYTTCDTPDIVYSDDPADCTDAHLFSVGERVDGAGYMLQAGECVPVPYEDHVLYHYAEQPLDVFPAAEDVDLGTGRVKVRRWGAAGVALSANGYFVDTGTGGDCLVRRGDDVRCTPTYYGATAQQSGAFTDSSCSVSLLSWGVPYQEGHGVAGAACPGTASAPEEPATIGILDADGDGAPEYFELGEEWLGDLYALNDSSICQPVTRSDGVHYVLPGAPIDLTTYPLLTEFVE